MPTGICLGATFDADLARDYGRVLGEETLAFGYDVLLGPCINLVRAPLGGRNFETLGEDPQLNGTIGTAYVLGLQGTGCGASVKHYCCNNQEHERMRGDSIVDGRTLREVYLPHFEMVVRQAKPWTVMCSYNRLNGTYVSEHGEVLENILRGEWGFDGFVISDWGAVHSTVAGVIGGTDLEMPGLPRYRGNQLAHAVDHWQIEESAIDRAAARILGVVERAGKLDGRPLPAATKDTPEHHAVALRTAEEGMVLLKNQDSVLPLTGLRRLAVIGRNAIDFRYGGGGSSAARPAQVVQPLEALRAALPGVEIVYVPGPLNRDQPPMLNPDLGVPIAWEGKPGLGVQAFDGDTCDGEPAKSAHTNRMELCTIGDQRPFGLENGRSYSLRLSTTYTPQRSGAHRFMVRNLGHAKVFLDGRTILDHRAAQEHFHGHPENFEYTLPIQTVEVDLVGGAPIEMIIELHKPAEDAVGWLRVYAAAIADLEGNDLVAEAARAAAASDAAVIIAGMPVNFETESRDRPHMRLPGGQNRLIAAVAAAQPRTVVALNVGSPVEMPWIDTVPAVLLTWFSGQEGARALARLLLGQANPSGHLPITFPQRIQDNPTYSTYPGSRANPYSEGILVGYRWYDHREIAPLFPFGHGLSYTTFAIEAPEVPGQSAIGSTVEVACTVINTGTRSGSVAVQVYVHDEVCPHVRPPQELKAFAKVHLKAGERRRVAFPLPERAFSYVDPDTLRWRCDAGRFEIRFGLSSRDLRATGTVELR